MPGFRLPGAQCQVRDWFDDPIDAGTSPRATARPPGPAAEARLRPALEVATVVAKVEPPAAEAGGSTPWSVSIGMAYGGHHYLTRPGPDDPLNEAILQLVGAYTRQFHPDGKPGLELQVPLQLQYSFTTGVPGVGTGLQLSIVKPFAHDKMQVSGFVQGVVNVAIGSPATTSLQLQPSLGGQLSYQPKSGLQIALQPSTGLTWQTKGPVSLDYGASVTFQLSF